MRKIHAITILSLILSHASFAVTPYSPTPKTMIKIVTKMKSSLFPAGSFIEQPVTLYRAGGSYCRREEMFDSEDKIHQLLIANEPDIWMINLFNHTGEHIVDRGPTQFFHTYLIPNDFKPPIELKKLEYGTEEAFFTQNHAKPGPKEMIDGKQSNSLEFNFETYRLILFTSADTHLPVELKVFKDSKFLFETHYLEYQPSVPFKAELFMAPKGIKFTERQ